MIDLMTLKPGIVAEVTENMGDGMWVEVRLIEAPDPSVEIGAVELCHAQDIVKVLGGTS